VLLMCLSSTNTGRLTQEPAEEDGVFEHVQTREEEVNLLKHLINTQEGKLINLKKSQRKELNKTSWEKENPSTLKPFKS